MADAPQAGRPHWVRRVALVVALAAAAYYATACFQVAREHGSDEVRAADVIVVFGAAEYVGRPSPIFRARLDYAFELYQRGLAPFIIVTRAPARTRSSAKGAWGATT